MVLSHRHFISHITSPLNHHLHQHPPNIITRSFLHPSHHHHHHHHIFFSHPCTKMSSSHYHSSKTYNKTYQETLDALESLINHSVKSKKTKHDSTSITKNLVCSLTGGDSSSSASPHKQMFNLKVMNSYLDTLKLKHDCLSFIHVAGTKGKGSTCAFSESILRNEGYKTGLFTSPHLIDVRERIRINGKPIQKDIFVNTVWNLLEQLEEKSDLFPSMTTYFRFMTLVALKCFIDAKVDVAIMEVGIGGRLDATNIIHPEVCGISSIGYDHCSILGDTLDKIALEKAGIMKPNVPVVVQPQTATVLHTFEQHAREVGAPLYVSPNFDSFERVNGASSIPLGLHGKHQRMNASLALCLSKTWKQAHEKRKQMESTTQSPNGEQKHAPLDIESNPLSDPECNSLHEFKPFVINRLIAQGLAQCKLGGRSQYIEFPKHKLRFYLDGAHTMESITYAFEWFKEAMKDPAATETTWFADVSSAEDLDEIEKIRSISQQEQHETATDSREESSLNYLVFNYTGARDPNQLLCPFNNSNTLFEEVYFVPTDSSHYSFSKVHELSERDRKQLENLQSVWQEKNSKIYSQINQILEDLFQTRTTRQRNVFVTGSMYLVGDVLRKLSKLKSLE